MAKEMVHIDRLRVAYDGLTVIRDATLNVDNGQFVSIVGKSGSGKTTLLNCVANLIPYQGSVEVGGSISYIFQDKSLFPWMTVKENIMFGLDGENKAKKEVIVSDVLEKVGLKKFRDRYPHELSGGQAQRVSIARSLSYDHELILCDEPFSALDSITKASLIDWFRSLIDGSKTFLFVTHSIEDAILLSDRVIIIADHRIAGDIFLEVDRSARTEIENAAWLSVKKKEIDNLINIEK